MRPAIDSNHRRAVIADHDDVVSVRAEDASGSFGILPGHADLITVLTPSVVAGHQRRPAGWCAVRRGVLSVHAGHEVAIATRQAQLGDDLAALGARRAGRFRAELDAERRACPACRRNRLHIRRRSARSSERCVRWAARGHST